jgi:hypothetical protein
VPKGKVLGWRIAAHYKIVQKSPEDCVQRPIEYMPPQTVPGRENKIIITGDCHCYYSTQVKHLGRADIHWGFQKRLTTAFHDEQLFLFYEYYWHQFFAIILKKDSSTA